MPTADGPLAQTRTILTALEQLCTPALSHARQLTRNGRNIDDFQVHCERLAYRATELRAGQDLLRYAETLAAHGQDSVIPGLMALAFVAEVGQKWLAEV